MNENDGNLLEVRDLRTHFETEDGMVKAVDGISFQLKRGETLGIVGESGSGKSVTNLSIIRLVPDPPGKIVSGEVIFNGQQLDWPWGFDRESIQQTINQADWLRKWIYETTGWKVSVKSVLSLPGWFVRESPSSTIRVVNPSYLAQAVRGHESSTLTEQQIDQIARQLEIRCRDVAE